jgi:hypothetical protein
VDPDDAFSSIPYEKGSRLLALVERTAGREAFDRFVRRCIARFRFTSITSEEWLALLDAEIPGVSERAEVRRWLYEPGMPPNAPVFQSKSLEDLTRLAQGWTSGARPSKDQIAGWSPGETLIYLQRLPRPMDRPSCEWLDANLSLTGRGNYEILVEWLTIAAASDHEPAFRRIREVLTRVGRMKYLRPLYTAMGRHPRTRDLSRRIFAEAGSSYHGLSRRVAESIIAKYPDQAQPAS